MNYKIKEFDSSVSFWQQLRQDFCQIRAKNIAASGGSAANLFDHLETQDLKQTDIYIADERFVDEDHQHSNAKLLYSKLDVSMHPNLHTWQVEQFENTTTCADNYALKLPKKLDLTILGVGPDGHTASLFPNGAWLENKQQLKCLATQTQEFDVVDRISLSYSEIEKSQHIWMLLIGKNKQEILTKIKQEVADYHQLPARKILDFGATIYFLNN